MPSITVTKSHLEDFFDGRAGDFDVLIDRGERNSPRSIELLMLGLGACTIATVQHFMKRKGMPTDNLAVNVASEFLEASNSYGNFRIDLVVDDEISDEQRSIINNIAKTCRIHKSLSVPNQIDVRVNEESTLAAS